MEIWERQQLERIVKTIIEEEGIDINSYNQPYQRGKALFELFKQEGEGLKPEERISYFLGYLHGVEAPSKDKKCLALAGISRQELGQKAGEILAKRREKEESRKRNEMINSALKYSCNFCSKEVNAETNYFSPGFGIYCNRECFALYTED